MFWQCLQCGITPFIITEDLRLFYYQDLQEWGHANGYLRAFHSINGVIL